MSQSLSSVLVHIVFSTKHRQPLIATPTRSALYAYIVGMVRRLGCRSLQIGGTGDHVHVLVWLGRRHSVASLVEVLKGSSSRWMKRHGARTFAWQAGYAAFSV